MVNFALSVFSKQVIFILQGHRMLKKPHTAVCQGDCNQEDILWH